MTMLIFSDYLWQDDQRAFSFGDEHGHKADYLRQIVKDHEAKYGGKVKRVIMVNFDYADLRKWAREELDIETETEILRQGHMANLGDIQIWVNRLGRGWTKDHGWGEEKGYLWITAGRLVEA